MEISKNIEIVGASLWLKKEKILVINDLHLGYEEALQQKGIFIPKFQLKEIIREMEHILKKIHPKKIVINGDLKHEFGKVLSQEWTEVLKFIDFLLSKVQEVIIIKGNHDSLTPIITKKRNIQAVKQYSLGDLIIVHGDEFVESKAKTMIIGHEHPAITLRHQGKYEKYKCFLKGKWKGKELIVVPSFNPLLEGTDILKEELLSPYLKKNDNFEVLVIHGEEAFDFGKVKKIREKL